MNIPKGWEINREVFNSTLLNMMFEIFGKCKSLFIIIFNVFDENDDKYFIRDVFAKNDDKYFIWDCIC